MYSVWGCGDEENTTFHVERRKEHCQAKNTELKISEASARALLRFFDNEKTVFHHWQCVLICRSVVVADLYLLHMLYIKVYRS